MGLQNNLPKCFAIVLAVLLTTRNSLAEDILKIGAIFSLTGNGQQYGDWSRKGAEVAVEVLNERGGVNGRKLEIIYEDSQNQTSLGISGFQKLVTEDKINAFIVHGSGVSVPLEVLSNRYKVLQMDVGSTTPSYRTVNDFTFRTAITAAQLSASLANKLVSGRVMKVALLFVNDEYGTGMAESFKKEFGSLGGSILSAQDFLPAETDFSSLLLRLRKFFSNCVSRPI